MASSRFSDPLYSLRASMNAMDGAFDCGNGWDDGVHDSFGGFLSREEALVRDLEYTLSDADNRIDAALAVNTGKYKSELNAFRSRLNSI